MLMISSAVEAGLFGRPCGKGIVDDSMRLNLAQAVFAISFQCLPHHEDNGLAILPDLMSVGDESQPLDMLHMWHGDQSDSATADSPGDIQGFTVFAAKFTDCGAVQVSFDIARQEEASGRVLCRGHSTQTCGARCWQGSATV